MAHKVIVPPKKNYIPQFLKQRDNNSYYLTGKRKGHASELIEETGGGEVWKA